jgi:RNA recognition motif-containing protein
MHRSLNLQMPSEEMNFHGSNRVNLPFRSTEAHLDPFLLTADDFSRTLFVGDISIFCDEKNLYELFSSFGEVDSIQLKKPETNSTKSHLSYGFIKFRHRDSAEIALQKADGFVFLGRALRLGWACDSPGKKSPLDRSLENHRKKPTAQLHVTFTSRHPTVLVTEASLRNVFNRFGDVVDVTVKKTVVNQVKTISVFLLRFQISNMKINRKWACKLVTDLSTML